MPLPNPIRVRLAVAVPLLGLVALLSCQNDSTGPKSSTSTVSTTLSVDHVRYPDSVSWKAMGDSGAFQLTLTSDTSFHVHATLPQPLGSDTLTLSAWTLTLRTTVALFRSDAEGNLQILAPSTKDSLSIRLLEAFDSLRSKSPAVWGSSSDPKATQIASLEKAYATLLLARDSAGSGFPAIHPVGIDSLAVVDQLLLLSAKDGYTYHTLDSLVPLDSAKLRTEVRALAVAGKLDSNSIFPPPPFVPNQPPSLAGALSISRTFDTTSQVVSNWITAISPGSSSESSQKVHFEVVVDSGADFFSALPTVDSAGTLRYRAKAVGKGVFQVRAHDNGDSTTGNSVNVSGWTTFSIQLFARPVLAISGIPDTIRLVEDSATTLTVVTQNLMGSVLAATFTPADTTLISVHTFALIPDATGKASFTLQAKTDVFGGPLLGVLKVTDSLDAISQGVYVVIAERNHPPTFGGAPSLVVTASAATRTYPGWIDSISSGPVSESTQKVSFQVQVLSGSSLFAKAPSVDSTGTLSFAGNANSSGLAQIQVRAVDNDSVDPGNRYSARKTTSIYFNQPPTLILPTHAVSTWENQPVTVGATTVSDQETSPANLSLNWTTSDSTILPTDSVFATFTGGTSRNITLHPVAHRWGTVKVMFTLSDSMGASAVDSLTLAVNPINHAPTLSLSIPPVIYSYKGAQTLGSVVWDDVSKSQAGRVEVNWQSPADTTYATISVSSVGAIQVMPKLDTTITLNFTIRAQDSAGTANGGVDTSAWSSLQTLQLVDTILDADGNSYRAKVLGTQTWTLSNLQRIAGTAACAYDSCGKYGRLYTWDQALNMTEEQLYETNQAGGLVQGICPEGWHVPKWTDWDTLQRWSGDSAYYKLRSQDSWTDTTYHLGKAYTSAPSTGSDRYGFSIKATTVKSVTSTSSGDMENAMGALLWESYGSGGGGYLPAPTYGFFAPTTIGTFQSTSTYDYSYASLRCVKDSTERSYTWIAP